MSQILAPTITLFFRHHLQQQKGRSIQKHTRRYKGPIGPCLHRKRERRRRKKYNLVPLNSSQTRFERYTPRQCYISRQDADSRWKGWRQMCMGVIRYLVTFCIPAVPAPQTPECQTVHPLDQRRLSLLPPVLSNCSPCPLQNRPARHELRISYLHPACWC